jgi:formylglycine-generating enzyme required for sulfatase activity
MKTLFLSVTLIISICLFAFVSDKAINTGGINIKEIEKSVAKINDTLYAGKYEVSNMLYLAFEKSLIAGNKEDLLKITRVDSTNWLDVFAQNEPYVTYYYHHPAYQEFPVVNISYEAANLFCEWLTTEYNAAPKKMFKKVLFRLPNETEWETAAKAGITTQYPWGDKLILNNQVMCNYIRIGDEYIKFDTVNKKYYLDYTYSTAIKTNLDDAGYITAPVLSYSPNDFGLYNVCGNVAEMVNTKGIARGGSWKNSGGDVTLSSRSYYNGTANYLGFRYFMVVIEK